MAIGRYAVMILAATGLAACGVPSNSSSGPDMATRVYTATDQAELYYGEVVVPKAALNPASVPVIEMVKTTTRCTLPKAGRGAMKVLVYGYSGGPRSPLFHSYKASRQSAYKRAARFDILVTETERPVYLVLASYTAVLWNLQLAPGAEIDGVSVLSYEGSAVANGPQARRVGFLGFRGAPHSKCYESGDRPLKPETSAARAKATSGYIATSSDMARWEAEYRAARDWAGRYLPQKIGSAFDLKIYPETGYGAEVILIGPVPEQPFAGQPIHTVMVADYVNPAWGTRADAMAQLDAIAVQALEEMR